MRAPCLVLLTVLCFSGCQDNLDSQSGSYTKLPNDNKLDIGSLGQATVIKVADADTITVRSNNGKAHRIRLQGIDAPEQKQAYGAVCKEKLQKLVKNREVAIEAYKKDRYQRIVAKVRLDDTDIALHMIKVGCGWHYDAYADEQSWKDQWDYAGAERDARQGRLGLWRNSNPLPPWEYRRK